MKKLSLSEMCLVYSTISDFQTVVLYNYAVINFSETAPGLVKEVFVAVIFQI